MSFTLRHNINLFKVLLGVPAPIYVQFALSKSCTMNCRMCDAVRSRAREEELATAQMGLLAKVLRSMGVGFIVLTGGEPLLRKDLAEVVATFARQGLTVRLQSNGMLFEKDLLRRLRDAGLDGITVSLHSLSPQTMDHLTGVSGSLDRVMRALCLYTEVFPPGRHVGGLNTVVTPLNLQEIPTLIRFATAIGMAISLIPVHLAGDDLFIVRSDDTRLSFGPTDEAALSRTFGEAIELKRQGHRVYNTERFLHESIAFLANGTVSWRCESPRLYFSISPSGIFLPCVDLPGSHSMLDPAFLRQWRDGAIAREIETQVSTCRGCMYACYPEFSYLLHSRRMFVRRIFDYRRISAPSGPLTMERIAGILAGIGARSGEPAGAPR